MLGSVENAYDHPTNINPMMTGTIVYEFPSKNGASSILPVKLIMRDTDIRKDFKTFF